MQIARIFAAALGTAAAFACAIGPATGAVPHIHHLDGVNNHYGTYPNQAACLDAGNRLFNGYHHDWFCKSTDGSYNPNVPYDLWRGKVP